MTLAFTVSERRYCKNFLITLFMVR